MVTYILRRVALGALVMLLATSALYVLIHSAPGDPASAMLGPRATPAIREAYSAKLGLDQPLPVQVIRFVGQTLHGDLGTDLKTRRPVIETLAAGLPRTVELLVASVLIAAALGIPLGCMAAVRRNSIFDRVVGVLSITFIAIPPVIIAIYGMLIFAAGLGWLPAIGAGAPGDVVDGLRHLLLPATAVGLGWVGYIARLVRASMIEVLSADFIRNARALGLPERQIIYRYALRLAVAPTVTVIGISAGAMLGSATFAEIVFARPGIGKMMYDAVLLRNYPVVQGAALAATLILVVATTLSDVVNALIDPRFKDEAQ